MLQEASAISRMAMNTGQMAGAAVAGLLVAAAGAGWALLLCGIGMVTTVPVLLSIRGSRPDAGGEPAPASSMLTELREGWSEFRSHTWLWVIVAQFCVVMMAWYGASLCSAQWWHASTSVARPPGARSLRRMRSA